MPPNPTFDDNAFNALEAYFKAMMPIERSRPSFGASTFRKRPVRRDRTSDRQMRQTTFLGLRPDKDGVWENGEWSSAIAPKGEDCGPRQIRGYFGSVKVREGDTWKVRMATYNLTPVLPPPPTTTIAP